jgi:transposase
MDIVAVIRHKVLTEGVPMREVSRQLGLSRNTIRRYVRAKEVPTQRVVHVPRTAPVRDAVQKDAEQIWKDRRSFTAGKQRLTAQRLSELLHDRGHQVSDRTVRRIVEQLRRAEREVTVPLVYRPGELAQVDFFEVHIDVANLRQKAWMFVMRMLYSKRDFVMLCARQDTTWFLAAHVAAFAHFAGVIAAIAYDNLSAAVAKVMLGTPRQLRPRFAQLAAHYAFEPRFCRPGQGHDKGSVERRGGNLRLQYLVPIPQGDSLAAISTVLQARLDARWEGDPERDALWRQECAALQSLPATHLDPSEVRCIQLRQHASHNIGGATYSVPSRWCGCDVEVRIGIDTIVFARGDQTVSHPRLPVGGRSIDYRHLLEPLSIKPQSMSKAQLLSTQDPCLDYSK